MPELSSLYKPNHFIGLTLDGGQADLQSVSRDEVESVIPDTLTSRMCADRAPADVESGA